MLGYMFAGVGGHFPGSFPVGSGVVATFDASAAATGLIFGAVTGLVIGTLQWLVLRAWLGVAWPWLVATALAVAVTHALGDGLPSSWEYPPIAVVGGLVMAGSHWLALRGRPDRRVLAIASGAAFAFGVMLGVAAGDPRSADWQTAHLVASAVAGAVVGVAVGTALLLNTRRMQQIQPHA